MQDAACELPRTPLLRASVNKGKEMTGAMQDPVYELPRIHLLRTRVNRAKIHPRFIVLCYKPYLSGPAPSRKRLSRQIALLAEKRARTLYSLYFLYDPGTARADTANFGEHRFHTLG